MERLLRTVICALWLSSGRCHISNTSTLTVQAFKRQNNKDSFLKVERHGSKINLSFTGNKAEIGTMFTFEKSLERLTVVLTIRPFSMPDHILAVVGERLVVKKLPRDSQVKFLSGEYKFGKRTISVKYLSNSGTVITRYHVLQSRSSFPAAIKANRTGHVHLGRNWMDCRAWLIIKPTPPV